MMNLRSKHESGSARGSLLIAAFLATGIFFQVLYLSTDLGLRKDMTQDQLFSLSGSTQKVLDKLEDRLVIEAYFSEDVPGVYQVDRQKIVDLLDEYDQMGGSKCQVVFYDPLEDKEISDKAQRLGIQEAQANDIKNDKISAVRFFQGLRIRYGGDEQKVLPLIQNAPTVEGQLTPMIRELVYKSKPKVGILKRAPAPANPYMRQQSPPDYTFIKRRIESRFEVVDIDLSKGQLLAEDLSLVVLVAPKDLTDWEKYQVDQHVMRGGGLIVLAEAADYSVGMYDNFRKQPMAVDTPDSKVTFAQMLKSYGVDLSGKVVADMQPNSYNISIKMTQGAMGTRSFAQEAMPYWIFVRPIDWAQLADRVSTDSAEAERLKKTLKPGLDVKHPMLDGSRLVTFFWPTKVGLVDPMPNDIKGQVLARTSPLALVEEPAMSTAPSEAIPGLNARIGTEREQAPIAVVVEGKFSSAWKGQDLPTRPLPEKKDAKNGGLLAQAAAGQGGAGQGDTKKPAPKKVDGGAAKPKAPKISIPKPNAEAPQQGGAKPPSEMLQGPIGPLPAQGDDKDKPEPMPARIDVAKEPGRVLVIGDASFVRDDFLQGLPPLRRPASIGGIQLYENAVDWMALDSDLIALRNKRESDRGLKFAEPDITGKEAPEAFAERVAAAKSFAKWTNILLPAIVLLAIGLVLLSVRSAEKRSFLANTPR